MENTNYYKNRETANLYIVFLVYFKHLNQYIEKWNIDQIQVWPVEKKTLRKNLKTFAKGKLNLEHGNKTKIYICQL